jgi:hypothetical protein
MVSQGDIVSYLEMCADFGVNLQRGMNFRLRGNDSIILMSLRVGAPYADRVEEGGRVLIYEGHDLPNARGGPNPKEVDQPEFMPSGRLTQNGLFLDAVRRYKLSRAEAELVRVYEKSETVFGRITGSSVWWTRGRKPLVDVRSSNSNWKLSISPLRTSPRLRELITTA